MHVYTAEAKTPPAWNEYGWDDPAPQLPSLEVFPDSCTVEEFAQNSFYQLMKDGTGNLSSLINDLNNLKGGQKATDAINNWYSAK
jgi:hypothetical protein